MERLAKVPAGQLLAGGIFPGLHGEGAPLWTTGSNVIFDNGGVRKGYGYLGLENLAARPTGLKSTIAETEPRCFIGAGNTAYRYRSSDGLTAIGTFASSGGVFDFLPWDTQVLINNGVDPLELWDGTASPSAPITAPFNRANCIFGYQVQAFAAGTDNGGQIVEWSSYNSITDWTPTALNSAGNLRLRELSGDIVAARPLGGSIGIYGRSNGGLFTYIGGTASYGFRRPISGIGAVSPYSVVAAGGRHYGVTQENVFVTDLTSFALIDEPAIRDYIKLNADWDRVTEVYGWHDKANNMVRWQLPLTGGGLFGIGYRLDSGSWTLLNDGVVCGEESGAFQNMFVAKTNRFLRQDKTTGNNDGVAMTAFVRTKPLDFGNRNRYKKLMKVSIDATWTGTVYFKIGYSNHPNDAVSWDINTSIANEIYPDALGVKTEAPFISFEIGSTAAGAMWRLAGLEVFGEATGLVNA